jgi:hypothetical protein
MDQHYLERGYITIPFQDGGKVSNEVSVFARRLCSRQHGLVGGGDHVLFQDSPPHSYAFCCATESLEGQKMAHSENTDLLQPMIGELAISHGRIFELGGALL